MYRLYQRLIYGRQRFLFFMLFLFLTSFFIAKEANAQGTPLCAEVKIIIEQKLSFERQAFDAKMVINNGLHDTDVKDVNIELLFMDKNEQLVTGTTDPNAVGAQFFYRTDSLKGIDAIDGQGIVVPDSSAEIHWLIIPAAGAAINDDGTLYYVGAKVTYTLNGVVTSVDVTPDYIVVKPQPMLTLDYFLPTDVYADDPFTDEVEPSIPFTLGVRIKNTGSGAALKTAIESAQPKIVENKLNLLIDFKILGGYVSDEPAGQSLLLNFGDIAGNSAKVGRWNMITTLSGQFVEFSADYSHADELGGAVTSLLEEVNTHTLVHDVKVDLPGRDNVRDFLALDRNVLSVYESDGVDTQVSDQSATAELKTASDKVEIIFPATTGFSYAKINDPYKGDRTPISAVRSDGKVIPPENIWLSQTRDRNGTTWSYHLHIFDVDSTGRYEIIFAENTYASISGFVFDDVNGNGIQEADERGVGVAKITLTGINEQGGSTSVTAYTDSKGAFRFKQIEPGQYMLGVADLEGMIDIAATAGDAGGVTSLGKISKIDLSAGTIAQGYLFAKQWSTVIPPSIKADLAIDMTASTLNPNVGEEIEFIYQVKNAGPDQAKQIKAAIEWSEGLAGINCKNTTDQQYIDGIWSINQLNANASVEMRCIAKVMDLSVERLIQATVASQTLDPMLENNEASVVLQAREQKEHSSIKGIVFYDVNEDGIQDPDEEGLQQVAVTLTGGADDDDPIWETVYTDQTGAFEFKGLNAGVYKLGIASRGSMKDGVITAGNAGGTVTVGQIENIQLAAEEHASGYLFAKTLASDVQNIYVQLAGISSSSSRMPALGEIIFIEIKVMEPFGSTVEGGRVNISWPANIKNIQCATGEKQIIVNGIWDVESQSVGGWELRCTAEVASLEGSPTMIAELTTSNVNLGQGVSRQEVPLWSDPSNQKASISGMVYQDIAGSVVFDVNDRGLPEVAVTLRGQDQYGTDTFKQVVTDSQGYFNIAGLEKGIYELEVAPVDGLYDRFALTGYASGYPAAAGETTELGKITNIQLTGKEKAALYMFAKAAEIDFDMDLSIEAVKVEENIDSQNLLRAFYLIQNKGADAAHNVDIHVSSVPESDEMICYGLDPSFSLGLPKISEPLVDDPILKFIPGVLIENGHWHIPFFESSIDDNEDGVMIACYFDKELFEAGKQQIIVEVNSETPDSNLANNRYVLVADRADLNIRFNYANMLDDGIGEFMYLVENHGPNTAENLEIHIDNSGVDQEMMCFGVDLEGYLGLPLIEVPEIGSFAEYGELPAVLLGEQPWKIPFLEPYSLNSKSYAAVVCLVDTLQGRIDPITIEVSSDTADPDLQNNTHVLESLE